MVCTLNAGRSIVLIVGLAAMSVAVVAGHATRAHGGALGFGGVSLGATEAEVLSAFPDAECRVAAGMKRAYRCFVKASIWGMPTGVWFLFSDADRSVDAIMLNFAPQYYGQVLPRLVLEFGQATEQRGASLFWKVAEGGLLLEGLGPGQPFNVFMMGDGRR